MGSSVISTGNRHVKVWRVDSETKFPSVNGSPKPKILSGRNCLLGPLINSTFSCSVAVTNCKTVVCTIEGDVCMLDDTHKTQRLGIITKVNFSIICLTIDRRNGVLCIAGEGGAKRSIPLDNVMNAAFYGSSSPSDQTSSSGLERSPDTLAIGVICDRLVIVNSNRAIEIWNVENDVKASALPKIAKTLPAHRDAVLGICSLLPKKRPGDPDLLTFSANGNVLFWMLDGKCTASIKVFLDQRGEHIDKNELKTLTPLRSDGFVVTGDKIGVLR